MDIRKTLTGSRGVVENLPQLLLEIEQEFSSELKEVGNHGYLMPKIYKPTVNTFFNSIVFNYRLTVLNGNNELKDCESEFHHNKTTWDVQNNKIDSIRISFLCTCSPDAFHDFIIANISHELLHAYEYYQRRIKGNSVIINGKSGEIYDRCRELIYNPSTDKLSFILANLFYMACPQERRANAQAIQAGVMELSQLLWNNGQKTPPSKETYYKTVSDLILVERLRDAIQNIHIRNSDEEIIESMDRIFGKGVYRTRTQANKKINMSLTRIIESTEKALDRAIKAFYWKEE